MVRGTLPVGFFVLLFLGCIAGLVQAEQLPGTELQITSDPADQNSVAVSADYIVWMDNRSGNWDIYLYDIAKKQESPVCTEPHDQWYPAISGSRIVWIDRRGGKGNDDIYLYDITTKTETAITTDGEEKFPPSISGTRIVWEQQKYNYKGNVIQSGIFVYDISTKKTSFIETKPSALGGIAPEIFGRTVVYAETRSGAKTIAVWDIVNGTPHPFSGNPGHGFEPDISGDRIVWYRAEENSNQISILMMNLTTGIVEPVCSLPGIRYGPAISGNRVVWFDYRGWNGNIIDKTELYLYDLAQKKEYLVVSRPEHTGMYDIQSPDISGKNIVWADLRSGNYDIYLFTIDDPSSVPPPEYDPAGEPGDSPSQPGRAQLLIAPFLAVIVIILLHRRT